MNGHAVGGFTRGLVGGAELKMRWDDRKRQQKFEDEDRKLALEDRKLKLEDRDYKRERDKALDAERAEDRAFTRSEREAKKAERDRQLAEEDAIRKVQAEAYLKAKEAQQGAVDANTQAGIETDAPAAAPAIVADSNSPPMKLRARGTRGIGLPPRAVEPGPVAGPQPSGSVPVPGAVDPSAAVPPPVPTDQPQEPYGRARIGRGTVQTNPPQAAPQPGGTAVAPVPGVMVSPQAGTTQQPAPPTRARGGQPTPPMPTPRGVIGPATAPNGLERAPVPSAAATPGAPVVTPSVEAATEAADAAPRGAKPVQVSDDFMTNYLKVGAPLVVEHYLSTGDTASAMEFQKFIDAESTKAGMEAWGKGTIAARMGDAEGAMEYFTEAFNMEGYFEDGYEVVPEQSGFTKGPDGSTTGAYISVRSQETGAIEKIEFDDLEEFMEFGTLALSPEAVFEEYKAQAAAAIEVQKGELEHQRALELEGAKAGFRAEADKKTPREQLDAEMQRLTDADVYGDGFTKLPPEEQVKKAMESLAAKEAAMTPGAYVRPSSRGVIAARGE